MAKYRKNNVTVWSHWISLEIEVDLNLTLQQVKAKTFLEALNFFVITWCKAKVKKL